MLPKWIGYQVLSFYAVYYTAHAGRPSFNGRLAAGPALSKREDTMQRSFGSRGSLFFYFTGKCGLTQVEKHIAAYILRG